MDIELEDELEDKKYLEILKKNINYLNKIIFDFVEIFTKNQKKTMSKNEILDLIKDAENYEKNSNQILEYTKEVKKMKETENLQQLMERFTKRLKQVNPDDKERVSYLKGCIDTVDYLATGKLPNDGNHDGMKNHRPRHSQLDALD